MTPTTTVGVYGSSDELAEAVCSRLLRTIADLQSDGRVAQVVLTGGSIADKIHAAVAASPAREAVDWARVELWWGDERFLASGHPDRNETQARLAMLDHLPVAPARVHPMPASDAVGDDPDRAADLYVEALGSGVPADVSSDVPAFDIVMLGVGPDGHVASLFPGHPALQDDRAAVAVRESPKPPPTRITLTMRVLRHTGDVWFVVAGDDKADAVGQAMSGADVAQVPAAGPSGTRRTLWLLDEAAAARVPAEVARLVES